jgi:hypothetical protein
MKRVTNVSLVEGQRVQNLEELLDEEGLQQLEVGDVVLRGKLLDLRVALPGTDLTKRFRP